MSQFLAKHLRVLPLYDKVQANLFFLLGILFIIATVCVKIYENFYNIATITCGKLRISTQFNARGCVGNYLKRSADLAPALKAGAMNRLPGIAGAWRVMRLAG